MKLATLESLTKRIKDAFDDSEADWTLTSYHFIRLERNFVRGPVKLGEKFQVTIQYEILLQEK